MKSYRVKVKPIPETEQYDGERYYPKTIKTFGTGHKIGTQVGFDKNGNLTTRTISKKNRILSPKDIKKLNREDMKYGDEAFAYIGLPNLIPTRLYEEYLLADGGYEYYDYSNYVELPKIPSISANFRSINSDNTVYINFSLSETSTKDYTLNISDDRELVSIITYTNKGGLICNIYQYQLTPEYFTLDRYKKKTEICAYIIYDSDTHGNADYYLSFNHADLDEVKAILDSIPIVASEE